MTGGSVASEDQDRSQLAGAAPGSGVIVRWPQMKKLFHFDHFSLSLANYKMGGKPRFCAATDLAAAVS